MVPSSAVWSGSSSSMPRTLSTGSDVGAGPSDSIPAPRSPDSPLTTPTHNSLHFCVELGAGPWSRPPNRRHVPASLHIQYSADWRV